ncbi:preprotein translocase subunit SecE [Candidatus Wolfebacteria bacterium RIFOXYB2_FULL_49_7]|uniref:Protein translocase subunit SecE n=1 Tax=Candidatus Wolfebacteria bacterium RIFOXYB1_FULL_54_12 TaxID=1802559 RepID=A0A1F8DXA6_9BACT|nr:MAG: preprotein translocase subunit SecE [Candidatus Wolfebacteria bacterium RIFOXYB1_FULL_54_12]OGM95898.1 MAG: preprotein translocase subunit SecE [Candidatus Wolfebacteria bacterium RIFOXYB2_FULL_49_7]
MFSRLTSYFQESQLEFKRVNWPTRQETIRLTGMVIGLSLIFAVFLGVLDMVFNYALVQYFI